MTTDGWLKQQEDVWGGLGNVDSYARVIERLKVEESRLIQVATWAAPKDADLLVAGILDTLSPPETPAPQAVVARFESLRPAITARVTEALSNGVVPHGIVWIVVNAFLRGDTSAVERVLPEGLRAVTSESGAVTVFEYVDGHPQTQP